jgi:hypothetical protein
MNKFSAGLFVNIGGSLHWFSSLVKTGQWNEGARESGERFGKHLADDLQAIGCDMSAKAARRFADDLPDKWGFRPPTDLEPRARELQSIIFDEMNRHLFFWVPPERATYYEYPEDTAKWNETEKAIDGPIRGRFTTAATEIVAARRSYAVAQYTACVFHLMRACEVGLKALYKTLNIASPKLADSWGNLLRPMDEQLKKNAKDRYGEWATNPDFFDQATNDVRAIKRAWRDSTMHIESDYDESEALKALNAVTSFFEHLSEKLDQAGNVYT